MVFKLMVSGHRDIKNHTNVYNHIVSHLQELYEADKDLIGLSGLAFGSDLLFARACITLDIPHHAYIPFPQQTDGWDSWFKLEYLDLLNASATAQTFGFKYSVQAYHTRNDAMLRDSTHLLAIWDGRTSGGTYSVVKKAEKSGKPMRIINPSSL